MRFLPLKNDEWRLQGAIEINTKCLRYKNGNIPAGIFFYHIHQQVQVRISPAAGINAFVIGNDLVINKFYIG